MSKEPIRPWTDYKDLKTYIIMNVRLTESGCWEWRNGSRSGGYGEVMIGGKKRGVHRVSYEEFKGKIPKGKRICHHCDNPRCVNPEHLYAGDAKTNSMDVVARGQSLKFKLNREDVENIKKMFQTGAYTMGGLARLFGVTPGTICHIIHNETWVGVGPDLWNGKEKVEVWSPAKLTLEQVEEIRRLIAAGVPQREIAQKYGVNRRTIFEIKTGKSWRR